VSTTVDERRRILLLSGASLVGQNVLASLAERRHELRLAAATSAAGEPIVFDFDEVFLTPEVRAPAGQYARRFEELLQRFRPHLVIPCRDDDVHFLAGEAQRRPDWRDRFLCGDAAVAAAMLDKLDSAQFSSAHGLPFAPTLEVGQGPEAVQRFAAAHGFPLLGKPRRGFASRGVRLLLNMAQLERASAQPDFLVQRYLGDAAVVRRLAGQIDDDGLPLFHSLEETKVSLQACIAPDGTVTRVFASGNVMRFGRSESVFAIDDPRIIGLARRWAATFAAAGWRGPLNIQCQRDRGGELCIYEYNGRFTGASEARRLLGFDEVGIALRDWLGLPLPTPGAATAQRVVRYLSSKALLPADIQRLQRDGCWSAGEADAPSA